MGLVLREYIPVTSQNDGIDGLRKVTLGDEGERARKSRSLKPSITSYKQVWLQEQKDRSIVGPKLVLFPGSHVVS